GRVAPNGRRLLLISPLVSIFLFKLPLSFSLRDKNQERVLNSWPPSLANKVCLRPLAGVPTTTAPSSPVAAPDHRANVHGITAPLRRRQQRRCRCVSRTTAHPSCAFQHHRRTSCALLLSKRRPPLRRTLQPQLHLHRRASAHTFGKLTGSVSVSNLASTTVSPPCSVTSVFSDLSPSLVGLLSSLGLFSGFLYLSRLSPSLSTNQQQNRPFSVLFYFNFLFVCFCSILVHIVKVPDLISSNIWIYELYVNVL
ncbi:hypothetical protein U1Q18_025496, partial [Sarracenia purpurea var. burkii]